MGYEIQSKLNLQSKTHHILLPSMFRLCPSLTQQAWDSPIHQPTSCFCTLLLMLHHTSPRPPKTHMCPPTSLHLINYIHLSSTSLLQSHLMAMEAFSSDSPLSNFTFTHTTQIQREENMLNESYNGFLDPQKC